MSHINSDCNYVLQLVRGILPEMPLNLIVLLSLIRLRDSDTKPIRKVFPLIEMPLNLI